MFQVVYGKKAYQIFLSLKMLGESATDIKSQQKNGQEKCLIFKTFTDIIFYMAVRLLLTMYICDKENSLVFKNILDLPAFK